MTQYPGGAQAHINRLEKRIAALEEGTCRYHCRTRSAMFKAGAIFVFENWNKCARPSNKALDQLYDEWRKENGIK
jgi:hypothetical protein